VTECLVIVGAGECGARAAVVARTEGWRGEIVIIGAEAHLPYERPQLSKDYLAVADHAVGPTADAQQFDGLGIRHLFSERVVSIDRPNRRVELASGQMLDFTMLLLATGAKARTLSPAVEGAIHLRDKEDSELIRATLRGKRSMIILGGGFIGLEVAAAAVPFLEAVTVIETQPRLLSRGVPAEIAAIIEDKHRSMGVAFSFGNGVAGITRQPDGYVVQLQNGGRLEAEALVVGIGSQPNVGLAEDAGLAVENGILTDEYLQASDPFIYAAGDCAFVRHPLFGGVRLRLESWRNALEQGELAARNMLGQRLPQTAVPWFWSDQYDLCLQVCGLPSMATTTIENRMAGGGLFHFHLDDAGRLVGVTAIGSLASIGRNMRLAEMLIARRATPDPAALQSAGVSLKSLL
jgi:3-phenylpropionate/trans-cinnamate dioxygenase ferredoxin reductase component